MGEINGWSVIERSFHNTKKRLMFTRCSTATSPPNCTVFVKFLTPQQILHSHPIRFIPPKNSRWLLIQNDRACIVLIGGFLGCEAIYHSDLPAMMRTGVGVCRPLNHT